METLKAIAMAEANSNRQQMVFDWVKAAALIKERNPSTASAGLRGDWEWTGGDIYRDGSPVPEDETYVCLSSNWATPEIDLDGDVLECFILQDQVPDWDANTYWPPEARAVLDETAD